MSAPILTHSAENGLAVYNVQSGRQLLREYTNIPDSDIDAHVQSIKDKALQVAPYPCIRRFRFLDLVLSTTAAYPSILARVQAGATFLDLACCLGQEIRKLVHDGAPSTNTYGADLYGGFFPVGYELFRDAGTLQTTFLAADLFDDASPLVKQLAGQVDIIYAGDLFHLFGLAQQEAVAARVVQLLRAAPGSMLVGRHSGAETPTESARVTSDGTKKHFNHNADSWEALWERVGEKTGTKWRVEAELVPEFKFAGAPAVSEVAGIKEASGDGEVAKLRGAKGLVYTITRQ